MLTNPKVFWKRWDSRWAASLQPPVPAVVVVVVTVTPPRTAQLHVWGLTSSSSSAFPAVSLGFTILLFLLLLRLRLLILGFTILLLLLPSQLYLWGSPFLVRFLLMWPFFNPAIEVVTFSLRGLGLIDLFVILYNGQSCAVPFGYFCFQHYWKSDFYCLKGQNSVLMEQTEPERSTSRLSALPINCAETYRPKGFRFCKQE